MLRQPYSKFLKSLIKEELDLFVNEMFDSKIVTKYGAFNDTYDHFPLRTYRFKTNSGNSYDLDFFYTYVTPYRIKLDDGKFLSDYVIDKNDLDTIDIGFTISEIDKKDDSISPEDYIKDTNRGEQIEVMGRIAYLVDEFIKNNPNINAFVIGRNTKSTKLKIYKEIFKNIFKEKFIMLEGQNFGYKEGAIYFINKNILNNV